MTCSDKAWRGLWESFNKHTTDAIRVDRGMLREVLACHDALQPEAVQATRDGLLAGVPRKGGSTVQVNRVTLFNLLNYHGAICNAK